jgi:hypothetical protein
LSIIPTSAWSPLSSCLLNFGQRRCLLLDAFAQHLAYHINLLPISVRAGSSGVRIPVCVLKRARKLHTGNAGIRDLSAYEYTSDVLEHAGYHSDAI